MHIFPPKLIRSAHKKLVKKKLELTYLRKNNLDSSMQTLEFSVHILAPLPFSDFSL